MLAELKSQQEEEAKFKAYCIKELDQNDTLMEKIFDGIENIPDKDKISEKFPQNYPKYKKKTLTKITIKT